MDGSCLGHKLPVCQFQEEMLQAKGEIFLTDLLKCQSENLVIKVLAWWIKFPFYLQFITVYDITFLINIMANNKHADESKQRSGFVVLSGILNKSTAPNGDCSTARLSCPSSSPSVDLAAG